MKHALGAITIVLTLAFPSIANAKDACTEFRQLTRKLYGFNEQKMTRRQMMAKERELDRFWKVAAARKKDFLPCIRAAAQNPKSNPYMRFDCSNLLVKLDPSVASKAQQVGVYTETDFGIVGAHRFVSVLSLRGTEGFDVSKAAERWLSTPKAHYVIPEHGYFQAGQYEGALFLYGSMKEEQATPALLKIIAQPKHPGREIALSILLRQATPQSTRAVEKLDAGTFSEEAQKGIGAILSRRQFIEPRTPPLISRAEYLAAFTEITKGNTSRFFALVRKVGDGERDAVAVLKPEDLPLVRKVRRIFVRGGNQHSMSFYDDFSNIIMELSYKSNPSNDDIIISPE